MALVYEEFKLWVCLFFYKCPRLKFKKTKKIHVWPKISQKVIFSVETWSRDQFLGFTYSCLFPRAHQVLLFYEIKIYTFAHDKPIF